MSTLTIYTHIFKKMYQVSSLSPHIPPPLLITRCSVCVCVCGVAKRRCSTHLSFHNEEEEGPSTNSLPPVGGGHILFFTRSHHLLLLKAIHTLNRAKPQRCSRQRRDRQTGGQRHTDRYHTYTHTHTAARGPPVGNKRSRPATPPVPPSCCSARGGAGRLHEPPPM